MEALTLGQPGGSTGENEVCQCVLRCVQHRESRKTVVANIVNHIIEVLSAFDVSS